MAKGLKPGNQVTVKENLDFTSQSDAYKSGLKSVTAGEVGQVVGPAKGRSVIVEFNGVQATVSSQRLQLIKKQSKTASGRRRPKRTGQANKAKAVSKPKGATPPAPKAEVGNATRRLITTLANHLLATGHTKPDKETVVEIRLADLPADVQDQIETLMRAKLELGLEAVE